MKIDFLKKIGEILKIRKNVIREKKYEEFGVRLHKMVTSG
jgi:hypothetical protein